MDSIVAVLGEPTRRSDSRWWWCCPFHHEEHPSFTVKVDTQWATCYGCGESMPAHELAKRLGYAGLAKRLVKDWERTRVRKMEDPQPTLPEWMSYRYEWSDRIKFAFPTFSRETLEREGIGFDDESHRATIPIRDEHGKLVGFSGRAVFKTHVRYKVYGEKELGVQGYKFAQTKYLWGAHNFYSTAVENPTRVFVVEGFKQRMRMIEAGYANTVSLMTRVISRNQLRTLERIADEVVLALDRNEAGRQSTLSLAQTDLRPYRVRGRLFYFGYSGEQQDHMSPEQLAGESHRIVPVDQLLVRDGKPTPLSRRARKHRQQSAQRRQWR